MTVNTAPVLSPQQPVHSPAHSTAAGHGTSVNRGQAPPDPVTTPIASTADIHAADNAAAPPQTSNATAAAAGLPSTSAAASTAADQTSIHCLTAERDGDHLAFSLPSGTSFHRLACPPPLWQELDVYVELEGNAQLLPQATLALSIKVSPLSPHGGQLIRLPGDPLLWHLRLAHAPPAPVTVPDVMRRSQWYADPSPPPSGSVESTLASGPQQGDFDITAGSHFNKDWICIYPRDDLTNGRHLKDEYSISLPSAFSEKERRDAHRELNEKGSRGLPCTVVDGVILINIYGRAFRLSQQHMTPTAVPNSLGEATTTLLKLRYSHDSICQPKAATPSASYICNTNRVVIDQYHLDGTSQRYHFDPHAAQIVDDGWAALFFVLADLTGGQSVRIPYAAPVAQNPTARLLRGIGVRLRDGGTRFPLTPTPDNWTEIVLPGDAFVLASLKKLGVTPSVAADGGIHIKLNIPATALPQDIILCPNESKVGGYKRLRYALRLRMDQSPIKDWQALQPRRLGIEAWVVAFFLNLARESRGCHEKDLIKLRDIDMR